MESRFSHIVRVRVEFLLGESHVSHIVGSRLETHVSHMVWSRVEGHFLALLGVVGQKINFSILLGSGGKFTFSYCWELSVIFLILLEVKSQSIS